MRLCEEALQGEWQSLGESPAEFWADLSLTSDGKASWAGAGRGSMFSVIDASTVSLGTRQGYVMTYYRYLSSVALPSSRCLSCSFRVEQTANSTGCNLMLVGCGPNTQELAFGMHRPLSSPLRLTESPYDQEGGDPNCLLVTGAGCEYVNGKYERCEDDFNGYAYYSCPQNKLELWRNDGEWRIGHSCDYYYTCRAEDPLAGRWQVASTCTNPDAVPSPPRVLGDLLGADLDRVRQEAESKRAKDRAARIAAEKAERAEQERQELLAKEAAAKEWEERERKRAAREKREREKREQERRVREEQERIERRRIREEQERREQEKRRRSEEEERSARQAQAEREAAARREEQEQREREDRERTLFVSPQPVESWGPTEVTDPKILSIIAGLKRSGAKFCDSDFDPATMPLNERHRFSLSQPGAQWCRPTEWCSPVLWDGAPCQSPTQQGVAVAARLLFITVAGVRQVCIHTESLAFEVSWGTAGFYPGSEW